MFNGGLKTAGEGPESLSNYGHPFLSRSSEARRGNQQTGKLLASKRRIYYTICMTHTNKLGDQFNRPGQRSALVMVMSILYIFYISSITSITRILKKSTLSNFIWRDIYT